MPHVKRLYTFCNSVTFHIGRGVHPIGGNDRSTMLPGNLGGGDKNRDFVS